MVRRTVRRTLALAWLPVPVLAAAAACSSGDNSGSPDASVQDATNGFDRTVPPDTSSPDLGTVDSAPADSGSIDANDAGSCPGAFDGSLDDAEVALGKMLVAMQGCAGCHQAPDAGLLSGRTTSLFADAAVYPKNLTPDQQTGLGCWTDPQIVNAILNGIDDQGMMLCVMPRFSMRGLDGGSAEAIATYLRSIPAVNRAIPDTVCPAMQDGGLADGDAGD